MLALLDSVLRCVRWITVRGLLTVLSLAAAAADAPSPALTPLPPDVQAQMAALPDNEKLPFLLNQAKANQDLVPAQTLLLLDHAQTLAHLPSERIKVQLTAQKIALHRGEYQNALTHAQGALDLIRLFGQTADELDQLLVISRIQRLLGQHADALQTLQIALPLCDQQANPTAAQALVYNSLGLVYKNLEEPELALDFQLRAVAIERARGPSPSLAQTLNNLGPAFRALGRLDEAHAALTEAVAVNKALGQRLGEADAHLNLASLEHELGQVEAAEVATRTALAVYEELNSKARQVTAHLELAEILLETDHIDEADTQLRAAKASIELLDNPRHQLRHLTLLSRVQEAQGNYRGALESARQQFDLRNKISGEQTKRTIADLRKNTEIARKNAAIAELERDRIRTTSDLQQTHTQLAHTRYRYLTLSLCLGTLSLTVFLVLQIRRRADRRILANTERARLEAESANDLKTRLLAVASHDLKSPLRAIELAARQLEAPTDQPSAQRDHASRIRTHATRMFSLIRDLIDLSALESGGLNLTTTTTSVTTVLIAALERHQPVAAAKAIHLRFAPPPTGSIYAQLDPARFDQVLDNLLDNACKFSPPSSTVTVTLTTVDDSIRIAVSDQGPGFSPADYARVFQAFQTLSAPATAGEARSGLGLHISHEIINRHGGRLGIDSLPGQGATLVIELPALLAPV